MKKRAQEPDAYTFTILLRGLAHGNNASREDSVDSALKIYHSLFNEKSKVKPSIIHTNAVLQVCSKAFDVDSMFSVAARLPEKGPEAPDSTSYTTIFNALNADVMQHLQTAAGDQPSERRQRAVLQGRRIWGDIVHRWRQRTIDIDERVVCAMGRLLLISENARDVDDILSLIEQTMRIPRAMPRFGDPKRPAHLQVSKSKGGEKGRALSLAEAFESESGGPPDGSVDFEATTDEPALEKASQNEDYEFQPLPPSVYSVFYPVPGNNTLSLALAACLRMGETVQAQSYWDKITETVQPDITNYHEYLRTLRIRRNDKLAVDLVEDMMRSKANGGLDVKPERRTFRIAIAACLRNSQRSSALRSGTRLLTVMQSALDEPDVDTIFKFTSLLSRRDIRYPIQDVVAATDILFRLFSSLRGLFAFGREAPRQRRSGHIRDPESEWSEAEEPDDPNTVEATSEALNPVSLDWSEVRSKARTRGEPLSRDALAKGHMPIDERLQLKDLAKKLEMELNRTLQLYTADMTRAEQKQIIEYRHTISEWMTKKAGREKRRVWKEAALARQRSEDGGRE